MSTLSQPSEVFAIASFRVRVPPNAHDAPGGWTTLLILLLLLAYLYAAQPLVSAAPKLFWTGAAIFVIAMVVSRYRDNSRQNELLIQPNANFWQPRRLRLRQLLDRASASKRFPHRVVELAYLEALEGVGLLTKAPPREKVLGPVMAHLNPGVVIADSEYPIHGDLLPGILHCPFEPIDAKDGRDAGRIVGWEAEQRSRRWFLPDPPEEGKERDTRAGRNRPRLRKPAAPIPDQWRIRDYATVLVAALIIAGLLYALLIVARTVVGPGAPLQLLALLPVIVALYYLRTRLMTRERVWLVPGGLVVAHTALGRKATAPYARREWTPLVFNFSRFVVVFGCAYVRVGNEIRKIPFGWPHLIAWVASAPPPSVEAVQALVGEETELVVAG